MSRSGLVCPSLFLPTLLAKLLPLESLCLQGSALECEILMEDNLPSFVGAWVAKAADSEGQAATISAQCFGHDWLVWYQLDVFIIVA